MRPLIDITGIRYDRLIVIRRAISHSDGHSKWECKCDCGGTITTQANLLRRGKTRSCGCIGKERVKKGLNRKPNGVAIINSIYRDYRSGAKVRGRVFMLTKTQFETLVRGKCFYCGSEPKRIKELRGASLCFNGIDRIDNRVGYTFENARSCCTSCNFLKGDLPVDDFLNSIEKIAANRLGMKKPTM